VAAAFGEARRSNGEVELLVNGRPQPPEEARPIEVGARPIDIGARPMDVGAGQSGPSDRIAKRFTYRVSLPLGSSEVHLRAVAYDATNLGSDPVEIVLRRAGAVGLDPEHFAGNSLRA